MEWCLVRPCDQSANVLMQVVAVAYARGGNRDSTTPPYFGWSLTDGNLICTLHTAGYVAVHTGGGVCVWLTALSNAA